MKNMKLRILIITLFTIALATLITGASKGGNNIAYTNQSNVFTEPQNFTGSINSLYEINAEFIRFPIRFPEQGSSHLIFEQAGRFNMWYLNGNIAIEYFVYAPNQALYLGQNGYPILPSDGNNIDLGNSHQKFRKLYTTNVSSNEVNIEDGDVNIIQPNIGNFPINKDRGINLKSETIGTRNWRIASNHIFESDCSAGEPGDFAIYSSDLSQGEPSDCNAILHYVPSINTMILSPIRENGTIIPRFHNSISLGRGGQDPDYFKTIYVTDVNSNRIKINNIRNCKQLGTDLEGYITCIV